MIKKRLLKTIIRFGLNLPIAHYKGRKGTSGELDKAYYFEHSYVKDTRPPYYDKTQVQDGLLPVSGKFDENCVFFYCHPLLNTYSFD
jgi:hypothetical protein